MIKMNEWGQKSVVEHKRSNNYCGKMENERKNKEMEILS